MFSWPTSHLCNNEIRWSIDPLHKWRLNLNNNTLYLLSLVLMSFYMNVRLRMYKYCYSNLGAIYTKGLLSPMTTNIVNQSLARGEFPSLLKLSHVRPRLRKDNLDKEILKNYRPVLIFRSLAKWSKRLSQPTMQSRKHHSTETTLSCVTNDILRTIDRGQDVVLVLPRFISGLWHYWSYDLDGKTRVFLWFLKIDAVLV